MRTLQGEDDVCTCGMVVAEVFQGLRRDQGRGTIRRSFEDMTSLEPPGMHLYLRAAELHRAPRDRGRTVRSTVDCIIAAIAENGGCDLLARDRDMDVILDSGLLKAGRWPPPLLPGVEKHDLTGAPPACGEMGIRHEHTVVVTQDACETRLERPEVPGTAAAGTPRRLRRDRQALWRSCRRERSRGSRVSEPVISVSELTRRFGATTALASVSLSLPRGAVYGLVGANGAGKTTLIKHILGLLRAESGSVRVFGLDPVADPVGVLSRIGYLSEENDLPGWMRVDELIRYSRAFYPAWDDAYAEELRQTFALDPTAKIKDLSKGRRRGPACSSRWRIGPSY